jgi:ribosomal-protein-alanine N-acetyltransferase
MVREDVPQVTAIDREAFPTQVPPPNYRHELQNKMAHYIVAGDDTKTAPIVEVRTGLAGLFAGLRRRLHRHSPGGDGSTPSPQECIIGFAGIWVLVDEAHITNLAVSQTYQRQGIGELLLISIIDLAGELNASMMTLEVRASNLAAQSLYTKYGFLRVGVRRGYYLDNREDGVIMTTEGINSPSFQTRLHRLRADLARRWGQPLPAVEGTPPTL